MTVVSLWMANLVSFMIFVPLELVAFWADNVWSLGVMGRMIVVCLGGMMFPLTLFPLWAQELSRWLPFAYTFHFPVATLMGRVSFQEWIFGTGIAAAWCFLFSAIITLIWKRGMLRYTGVGI
jgi:ABC-2 type transport system permease protein